MGKKDDQIRLLEEQNAELEYEVEFLEERIQTLKNSAPTPIKTEIKHRYAGSLSFDFWPPRDWLRWGVTSWNPGKYFQLNLGPIRLDFYAD